MATLFSLKSNSKISRAWITMDNAVNKISLSLWNGNALIFEQYQNGLYIFGTGTIKTKHELNNYFPPQTVTDSKRYFTRQEIK